jgi:transcriptional regulator with XRE-family HTH domain
MRKLRLIRQQKALSLRALERLSGVDYSSISKIETGGVHPEAGDHSQAGKSAPGRPE